MDLKMGTGKIAAQVGHAALRAYQYMRHSSSINNNHASLLIEWMENGQKNKILQA
jgi:peptidyl-tRNA hydrolase